MKTLSSIIFFSLFFSLLNGQIYSPTEAKTYQSLIGDVFTLSVFVDTDEDYWSGEEIEHFYGEFLKSQEWIIEEAANFGQEVKFTNDHFLENKQVIRLSEVKFLKDLNKTQKQIFNKLGYDDFQNFLDKNIFDFKTKRLKLLVFVKSRNRSHAYNRWSNTQLDVAFIYCQKTFGSFTDQFVIAHELLHQFGAWDLYYGESQTREQADKAKELFPHSIMISTSLSRNLLQIDSLTAWRIGWHNDVREEYSSFYPQRKNRRDLKKRNSGSSDIQFDWKELKQRRKEKKAKYGYNEEIYTSWNINHTLNFSSHADAEVVSAKSGRWRLGFVLSDKLSLETGIDINRVGYGIEYFADSVYLTNIFGRSSLLRNAFVNLKVTEKFRGYPFQINYMVIRKKHFEVSGYFNVMANFYRFTYSDGLYFYQTPNQFRFNSTRSIYAKENTAVSYEIGGLIRKKMFGRFSIFCGINFQHLFHKEDWRITEKYQYFNLGAMLGVRYELKREKFEKK